MNVIQIYQFKLPKIQVTTFFSVMSKIKTVNYVFPVEKYLKLTYYDEKTKNVF